MQPLPQDAANLGCLPLLFSKSATSAEGFNFNQLEFGGKLIKVKLYPHRLFQVHEVTFLNQHDH